MLDGDTGLTEEYKFAHVVAANVVHFFENHKWLGIKLISWHR